MNPATRVMIELWALSRCFRPDDPMPDLVDGDPMRLTLAGRYVADRLLVMVDEALAGPAGWDYRSTLLLARTAFDSGDGEAVCAAAAMLHALPLEVAA